jgi:hypothetical protein
MEFAVKAFWPGKTYGMQFERPRHAPAHGDRALSQNNHKGEVSFRVAR